MVIDFFDVQAGISGANRGCLYQPTSDKLLRMMNQFNINRAVVRITSGSAESDVLLVNQKLYTLCKNHQELIPCPIVVPNSADDFPTENEQINEALANNARMVWIRPKKDHWVATHWCSEKLFQALEERHLPTFISAKTVSIETVANLAMNFPALPLIYAESGYQEQRMLVPLIEKFSNVFLSLGNCYTSHCGIEQFIEKASVEQLLFGTGYPISEPMSAIMQVMNAAISEDESMSLVLILRVEGEHKCLKRLEKRPSFCSEISG